MMQAPKKRTLSLIIYLFSQLKIIQISCPSNPFIFQKVHLHENYRKNKVAKLVLKWMEKKE
jgi:hypothetical protein